MLFQICSSRAVRIGQGNQEGSDGVSRVMQGQVGSSKVRWGQVGSSGVKWGPEEQKGVKWGQVRLSRVKWDLVCNLVIGLVSGWLNG